MNFSIIELLGLIIGSGGLGAFILKMLNIKSDNRKNAAEASIAEISIDSKKLENLEKTIALQQLNYNNLNDMFLELLDLYKTILKENAGLREAVITMQTELQAMRLELEAATKRWKSANAIKCEDFTCTKRIPPIEK